nr:hypothetical protein Q903MT_gene2651 [Picea sitchensis]
MQALELRIANLGPMPNSTYTLCMARTAMCICHSLLEEIGDKQSMVRYRSKYFISRGAQIASTPPRTFTKEKGRLQKVRSAFLR